MNGKSVINKVSKEELEELYREHQSRAKNGWKGGGRLSTLFGYRRLFRSGGQ